MRSLSYFKKIPSIKNNELSQVVRLKTKLDVLLGLQQIDVIVARDPNRLIEQEAAKTKVCL